MLDFPGSVILVTKLLIYSKDGQLSNQQSF